MRSRVENNEGKLNKDHENILDQASPVFQVDSIDFDLKIVRGFALSFFIYGLVYWIQIQKFLVPLPMVYFFVPVAGLIMFIRSIKWYGAFLFLLIPFIVVKDFTIYSYPNLTGVFLLITFLAWSGWSWYVFMQETRKDFFSWILPITQTLIWLVWLIQIDEVRILLIILLLIGTTVFVKRKINDRTEINNLRVGLLIQLVTVLFLMQQLSFYWVGLG